MLPNALILILSSSVYHMIHEQKVQISMDTMIDRALIYMDQFDQSNENLNHFNQGPIKHKGSNLDLNRPKLNTNVSKWVLTVMGRDMGAPIYMIQVP